VMYEGMIELKQANYGAALQRHEYAMQLAQTRHDPRQESIHLTNLARVNMRLGQYELALDQFHRSFQMKNELKDYTGMGFARFYEGLICIYRGQLDEAERVLKSAQEAWLQVQKNERLMAYYHYGAGSLALSRGQPAEADENLQKALDLCARLDLRAETIENLSLLGQARLGQGDLDGAQKASSQAIKLLEMQKDVEEVQQVLFNHYRILAALNSPQAADALQRAYDVMLQCATRIENEAERKIYLEQVKVNQDIQTEKNKMNV
jgi:tetratricopeptide (TPR) repeat protein